MECCRKRVKNELKRYDQLPKITTNYDSVDCDEIIVSFMNFRMALPSKYPFIKPVIYYTMNNITYDYPDIFSRITPGNSRACLFSLELYQTATKNVKKGYPTYIDLLNPKCCVMCSSLNCYRNWNVGIPFHDIINECLLVFKYRILTSKLHLRYVNNLFPNLQDDILLHILKS